MEPPSSPPPTRPLEEAARCPLLARDPEAWIRCCTARFMPVARRVARNDDAARDALQESWLIVMQKIRQYRGGPPACAWVARIVRHEAARVAVTRARRREVPLDDGSGEASPALRALSAVGASPEAAAAEQEMTSLLLAVIDELPPKYREVVRLRDFEEQPPEDVARRLRISRHHVAVRLNRAHGLMRQALVRRLAAARAASSDAPPDPAS